MLPGTAVLLTDFGLARATAEGSRFTRTGEALGTPAYMSPEQTRGDSATLTPAADVWGLGAVLYELLAGRRPFEATSEAAVVAQVVAGAAPPLTRVRPDLPAGLAPLVHACLTPAAAARPPGAAALRDDLDRVLRGHVPRHRSRARRGPLVAVGAAAVAVAVIVARPWSAAVAPPSAEAAANADAEAAERAWAARHESPATAAAILTDLLRRAPDRHDWRLRLGLLQWASGALDSALATWHAVPAGSPHRTRAQWLRALAGYVDYADEVLGAPHEAMLLPALREASAGSGPEARWARAALALYHRDLAQARALLAGAPGWEPALLRAAVETMAPAHGLARDDAAALRDYTEALTTGVPLPWVFLIRGSLREDLGDATGARADYDRALAVAPGFPEALINRAGWAVTNGDPRDALADCAAALPARPRHAGLRLNRARAYERLEDFAAARADVEIALATDPGFAKALALRARLRLHAGEREGARADFDAAVAGAPRDGIHRYNRGVFRLAQDDLPGALEDFDAALALDPEDHAARLNRGIVHARRDEDLLAIADFERILAAEPTHAEARYNRGVCREAIGDLAGALADLDAVARQTPDDAQALEAVARLRARTAEGR